MSEDSNDLQSRLDTWLASEGYPLEYYTASIFKAAGFDVHQGLYTRDRELEKPREMDVVAQVTFSQDHRFIRIENIIECKWSGDKPLIVFTSKRSEMAPSACIAQTISSELGDALLWISRGEAQLRDLGVFQTPAEPAFGGRQAFGSGDQLYKAMASVTSACAAVCANIDRRQKDVDYVPEVAVITLPVVVVGGRLFEARYDEQQDRVVTLEVDSTRCHWHGAPSWPLTATIDIVTRTALPQFAARRSQDMGTMKDVLEASLDKLKKAFAEKDRNIVFGNRGPSGRGGAPRLLSILQTRHK